MIGLVCPKCGEVIDWQAWHEMHRTAECVVYKYLDDCMVRSMLPKHVSIKLEFQIPNKKEYQTMAIDLTDSDLDEITETALEFFWERVAKRIPPLVGREEVINAEVINTEKMQQLKSAAFAAVKEWYNLNAVKDMI